MQFQYIKAVLKKLHNKKNVFLILKKDLVGKLIYHYARCTFKYSGAIFLFDEDSLSESIENQLNVIISSEWIFIGSDYPTRVMQLLIDKGFARRKFIIGKKDRLHGDTICDLYDIDLGYSRSADLDGIHVLGDQNDFDFFIAILGNSTSDIDYCGVKAWPAFLYERMEKEGIKALIYCAAMPAMRSSQELVKLIRDIIPLKPDMVLSYSGANNAFATSFQEFCGNGFTLKYKYDDIECLLKKRLLKNKLQNKDSITRVSYGLHNNLSYAESWINDERMMYAICKEFNISFWGFLEPCRLVGNTISSGYEFGARAEHHKKAWNEFYVQAQELLPSYEYIYDLSDMYDNMENIYLDSLHVFETGNKIAGDKIFEVIKFNIMSLIKAKKEK